MYELQIFLFFLSLVFSFLMILWIQKIKKPVFEMQVSNYSFHDQNRMKIAHIKVRNRPVKYLSRFMNRDIATNCRADASVIDQSNGQLIKAFGELKWAMNPEPLKYDFRGNNLSIMADPTIMMTTGLKNLGERWEDLDIAVKHEGDAEFYVNTPRNYPLNRKPDETRISQRRCFIDITIRYDNGYSRSKRFYLRNASTQIVDFELSEHQLI